MNNSKLTFKLLAQCMLFAILCGYAPILVSGVKNEESTEKTIQREDPPGPPY